MRKSVGLLAAAVMFIAVMSANMVCYGAEPSGGAGEQGSSGATRSVNTQDGSITKDHYIVCGNVTVGVIIGLAYAWDEGYTGWFTTGGVSRYYIYEGTGSISSPSAIISIVGGTIIFDFELTVNGIYYTDSVIYTVDEYGTVYGD